MRIISYNGCVSVNFNHVIIYINDNVITCADGDKHIVLGKYASEEEAAAVFEEIHENYNIYNDDRRNSGFVFRMPQFGYSTMGAN